MLLNGNGIPFDTIDIAADMAARKFMQEHARSPYEGMSPVPPQIFYNDEWLGVSGHEALLPSMH